jgi:hypothetical protein
MIMLKEKSALWRNDDALLAQDWRRAQPRYEPRPERRNSAFQPTKETPPAPELINAMHSSITATSATALATPGPST